MAAAPADAVLPVRVHGRGVAQAQLDRLVDKAFGAEKPCQTDEERLAILFARYKELKDVRA